MPDFSLERSVTGPVAGVDEAGRGPWAGPVVAAAAILPYDMSTGLSCRLDDSKKLKSKLREALLVEIEPIAQLGVGIATPEEIDALNIHHATMLAMRRAVDALPVCPAIALVDGNRAPDLDCKVLTVVKGDGRSFSIAAASIVAKVNRDRMMSGLAERYPGYGWERNVGYGTKEHREAISRLGVTPAHRRSFAPIRKALTKYG